MCFSGGVHQVWFFDLEGVNIDTPDDFTHITKHVSLVWVLQTLDNPCYELIGYSIYCAMEDGQTATSVPHHHTLPS